MYLTTGQVPSIYQWDPSSRYPLPDPGSAPSNCGPTAITFIANFYRDLNFGIYATRRLVVADPYRGTSANEQRDMLIARGVKAYISQPSVEEMHRIVDSGRRPMVVGLWMAKVPAHIRDHDFLGMHAVVLRARTSRNGIEGFVVLDPNFSRKTGRLDPDEGKKFYPDWVIREAFVDKVGSTRRGWAIIPTAVKAVTTTPPPPTQEDVDLALIRRMFVPGDVGRLFDVRAGIQLYTGPGTNFPKHFRTTVPVKYRLVAFDRVNGKQTGWVWATNPNNPDGYPFCVPPVH